MTRKRKIIRRIEIIDIAKCIAIFMVILGHTSPNEELVANTPMLTKVLYSIHMPLFFFLSGLSLAPKPLETKEAWRFFFRKLVLTLLVPYFIWGLIYCNFSFRNVGWIFYGSWIALGKAGTLTSLWYLICFFLARVLVQLVFNMLSHTPYGGQRLFYLIPAGVCVVIAALFPNTELGYPWCLDVAFAAAGCLFLGVAVRDGMIRLSVQKGWVLCGLLAGSVMLYWFLVRMLGENFGMLLMCGGIYGNSFFTVPLALLGGFAVMVLSMLLKRMADEWIPKVNLKSMIYLGQHTMGVFLLHKPMLQQIFVPAFRELLSGGPDIMVRLLATVAALIISMWLCRLIEYYIPELVGIFSKDVIAGSERE